MFDTATVQLPEPDDRAKLQPLMGSINAAGAAERDAAAFVAFLDAQPQVNKAKKIGTQGYCMGGPLVDARPRRRSRSHRRRRLVPRRRPGHRQAADSPHLLAPKIKARMYFGIAANDDQQQPDAKDKLKAAFAAAQHTRRRSRSTRTRCTAGACRTCRRQPARRSTTSLTPSAPGASCWRCTRRRSPETDVVDRGAVAGRWRRHPDAGPVGGLSSSFLKRSSRVLSANSPTGCSPTGASHGDGSAPGGAAPFAATRSGRAVHVDRTSH